MKEQSIFAVRQLNEDGTKWGITVGNHLATPVKFDTKEEAKRAKEYYDDILPWETVIAGVAEMIDIHDNKMKMIERNAKTVVDSIIDDAIKKGGEK